MEAIKTAKNVEFDVIYDGGEKIHVKEGVLFQFIGNHINSHIGTYRKEAIFAIVECVFEMAASAGMIGELEAYLNRGSSTPEEKGNKDE